MRSQPSDRVPCILVSAAHTHKRGEEITAETRYLAAAMDVRRGLDKGS